MRLAEIMVDVGETPVFCPQHYSERWVIHIIFEGFPASLKLNAKPQNLKQPQATRASNCAVFGLVSNCECPDPGLSGPELASVNRCFGGTSGQMGMAQQCGTKQIERRLAVLFITTSKLKINWSHAKFKFHGFLTGEPGVEISKHFITFTAKHLQLVYHLLTLPKGTYGSGWLIAQNIQNQAPKSETVRCMCVCACIRMFLRLIKSVATDWVWGSISLPSHLVNSRESQLTSY